jgi:hypothetical protein
LLEEALDKRLKRERRSRKSKERCGAAAPGHCVLLLKIRDKRDNIYCDRRFETTLGKTVDPFDKAVDHLGIFFLGNEAAYEKIHRRLQRNITGKPRYMSAALLGQGSVVQLFNKWLKGDRCKVSGRARRGFGNG